MPARRPLPPSTRGSFGRAGSPSRHGLSAFWCRAVLGGCSLLFVVGAPASCAPAANPGDFALDKLPKYEGRGPILYTDYIEPAGVGMGLDTISLKNDRLFRERVQGADGVARMRVVTVSTESRGGASSYRLQLAVVEKRMGGIDPATRLDIDVKPGSASYGIARKLEEGLANKVFVVAWKRFQENGEGTVHFYAAPDDAETNAAAREGLVLQEVKGQ